MYQTPLQTEHHPSSSFPPHPKLNTNNNLPLTQANMNLFSDMNNPSKLEQAFLLIIKEVNQRDLMIKNLQEEIASLKKQLQLQTNPASSLNPYIPFNQTPSNRINYQHVNTNPLYNQSSKDSPLRMNDDTNNKRNVGKMGYHSDTEKKLRVMTVPKVTTPICGGGDITGGVSQSRIEVKNFLKEVKGKVDPHVFKEFIRYIKILTNKSGVVNRKGMIENVKLLFGTEHEDLYNKFEEILCVKKMDSK